VNTREVVYGKSQRAMKQELHFRLRNETGSTEIELGTLDFTIRRTNSAKDTPRGAVPRRVLYQGTKEGCNAKDPKKSAVPRTQR
jgi:hypothetical protein